MKRVTWLVGACLLGGLMVVGVVSGLRTSARAAEVTALQAPVVSSGDVVINEVLFNPSGTGENAHEWIELHNATGAPLTLSNWTVADGTSSDTVPDVTIPAHGFVIVAASASFPDDYPGFTGVWVHVGGTIGSGLNNSGDSVTLRDDVGALVDGVSYGDNTTYWNCSAYLCASIDEDHSMERDPAGTDTDSPADFVERSSPTPGNGNVPQTDTADLVVTKIGPVAITPGSLITYHIALSNTGSTTATTVRVTDTLPAAVNFVTQTTVFTFDHSGRNLVWQLGDVPTDTLHLIIVTGRVTGTGSGTLTNLVTATTTASETVPSNNVDDWSTGVVVTHSSLDVAINEVAWMGTDASWSHEWIELYNTTEGRIDLHGWTLSDHNGTLATLTGTIPAGSYYLLAECTTTFSGTVPQIDQLFSGNLRNDGEPITLTDSSSVVIDTANTERRYDNDWAAGSNTVPKRTMERISPTAPDTDANWCTNDGVTRNGQDTNGKPINGTPKARNSCHQPPAGGTADLVVAKTGPAAAHPGGIITYHIALSNTGSIAAAGTLLTDTLPAAVEFITQTSHFTFTSSRLALVWQLGDVPTASLHIITITGRVADTGSGTITNLVTATTIASETVMANNIATWETTIGATGEPQVLISAVLYDGYQSADPDEAVQLINVGTASADLAGWELCKDTGSGLTCRALPSAVLSPTVRIWLARRAVSFTASFGFPPDHEMDIWLPYGLADAGDEVVLRDGHATIDAVVYKGGNTDIVGWSGPAVQPYSVGRETGQILYRIPDEATSLPATDTDTAADWIQYASNVTHGRRVLYPGWDLDSLFWPLTATEQATVVVGVAPDNAFNVVSQTIARAQHTISIEVYSLRNPDVVTALVQKAQEGVDVTVLLEGQQARVSHSDSQWQQELWACQQIEAAGGQCWFMIHETGDRIFNRYDYLHAKFLIVDSEWLVIGSQNLTDSSLPSDDKSNGTSGSRGVVLAMNGPSVVARAAEVFARDLDPVHHNDILRWNAAYAQANGYGHPDPAYTPVLTVPDYMTYTVRFPDPLTMNGTFSFELFTAPEAALRQSDALLGLLAQAGVNDTVYVEQLYEHVDWGDNPTDDPNLRLEAYIAAARRGATMRVLLNGGTFDGLDFGNVNTATVAYVNQIARAEGLDLEAAIGDPTQWGIHSKMVLVWLDKEENKGGYTHAGSINGSESSNKINREMALQVKSDEIYRYLAHVFEVDWWLARPVFLPLAMRNYTTPPPPVDYAVISEVYYAGSVGVEWAEICNPTEQTIDLSGYKIGDAETDDRFEGMYQFPPGTTMPPQGVLVIAFDGSQVPQADFEMFDHSATPDMIKCTAWGAGDWTLRNDGDQVLLLGPTDQIVDVVVWGDATYPGVSPHPGVSLFTHSLERYPHYYDTDDCAFDFRDRYPPTPGVLPE